MNEEQQAFDDLQFLTKRFHGVLALAAKYAKVGSVEQAAREQERQATDAIGKLRAEQETVKRELVGLRAQYAKDEEGFRKAAAVIAAQAEGELTKAKEARAEADNILGSARANAATIESEAKVRAQALIKDAQERAAVITHKVAPTERKLAGLLTDVETAESKLASVAGQMDELKVRLTV